VLCSRERGRNNSGGNKTVWVFLEVSPRGNSRVQSLNVFMMMPVVVACSLSAFTGACYT